MMMRGMMEREILVKEKQRIISQGRERMQNREREEEGVRWEEGENESRVQRQESRSHFTWKGARLLLGTGMNDSKERREEGNERKGREGKGRKGACASLLPRWSVV